MGRTRRANTIRLGWSKRILGFIGVLVVVLCVLALLAQPAADHPFFARFEQRRLVMAHQGGKGLWPENTLYAFEQCVALGVDVLEMDIHSTADDVLVVMHDSTVDRTTGGTGPIHEFMLVELKALDAGYNWSPDDGLTFPYRGQGITVPTLEEVFDTLPTTAMNIEIKQEEPSLGAPLCQLIREKGMTDRVLVASFHDEGIGAFRRECPEVATSTARNEVVSLFILSKVFLEGIDSPLAQAAQVPEYRSGLRVLTPRFVDAVHSRNLQVHAWTVNNADDMQRMLALGVDGIITDYPDQLLELLGR